MEFYYYSPSETFVVLTADQFVGHDDGLLEQQRQDIHVCRKNCTRKAKNFKTIRRIFPGSVKTDAGWFAEICLQISQSTVSRKVAD